MVESFYTCAVLHRQDVSAILLIITKIMVLTYSSEISYRRPPANLHPEDEYLFRGESIKELPSVNIQRSRSAFMSPSGHLFNGIFLDTRQNNLQTSFRVMLLAYIKSIISLARCRGVRRIKEAYFVTNYNSTNFFHWFFDVLQKLEYLSGNAIRKEKDLFIIVPYDHQLDFIVDTLSAFDFTLIIQKNHQSLFIDKLTLLPDIAPTGNYRNKEVNKLRNRLRCQFLLNSHNQAPTKRVYITRKNARKRRVINENDLLPILKRSNFEIVDMDDITFEEQIELMSNVNFLISLHGAGLTHMIWMDKLGSVLEIRARGDANNNCYFTLASELNLNYFYALADKINPSLSTQKSDYLIDPICFETQLLLMVNHSRPCE